MPVSDMRSGTVMPSSGARDSAAHKMTSGRRRAAVLSSGLCGRGRSRDSPAVRRLVRSVLLIERVLETSSSGGRRSACRLAVSGDGLVGDQVGAGAPGCVVLGCGDEELAGRVERVRLPAGGEHALAEDEVDVLAFADAEADPDVHLGADRALAHGLLGRPLGGGDEGDGDGPAAPGDRVGVARWRSGASSASSAYSSMTMTSAGMSGDGSQTRWPCRGEVRGAGFEDGHRVGQQCAGLGGCGGQPVDAGCPRAEFHAPLEVDGPDDHVAAGGEVAHEHVEAAALARLRSRRRTGRAGAGTALGTGVASSNGPRSMGSVMEVIDGPGQVIASACGSLSSTRSSKRLARSSGVG